MNFVKYLNSLELGTNGNRTVVMYHHPCNDGTAAAAVMAEWLDEHVPDGDRLFHPVQYGDPVLEVGDKDDVIILDFSFKNRLLSDICNKAKSVTLVDHHQSALKIHNLADSGLHDNLYAKIDMTMSGSMLLHTLLNPDVEPSKLLVAIQDKDIWKWENDFSRAITSMLDNLPRDIGEYRKLIDPYLLDRLQEQGQLIVDYEDRHIDRVCSGKHPIVELDSRLVPLINASYLKDFIGEKMSVKYPFVALYKVTVDQVIVSLRSSEDGFDGGPIVDVCEVAELFGGGGHKCASAFRMTHNDLTGLLDNNYGVTNG